jgi:heme-degrading monooxygenase HmoA
MYARLTNFPLRPGSRAQIETIMDKYAVLIAGQPGHCGSTFCFDATGNQFTTLTLWSSQAEAEAGPATLRDTAQREMGELLSGPPITQVLEVYAPRTASPVS